MSTFSTEFCGINDCVSMGWSRESMSDAYLNLESHKTKAHNYIPVKNVSEGHEANIKLIKEELARLLTDIDTVITNMREKANDSDIYPAEKMRDMNGNWVFVGILNARAQVFCKLADLEWIK